jgi:hypothetical protein
MPDFARRPLAVGQERQVSNSNYRTPKMLPKTAVAGMVQFFEVGLDGQLKWW